MVEEKNWYRSKTVWGALVAIFASVSGSFGLSMDAGSQGQLTEAILQLISALGAVFALYGRLTATDVIS